MEVEAFWLARGFRRAPRPSWQADLTSTPHRLIMSSAPTKQGPSRFCHLPA